MQKITLGSIVLLIVLITLIGCIQQMPKTENGSNTSEQNSNSNQKTETQNVPEAKTEIFAAKDLDKILPSETTVSQGFTNKQISNLEKIESFSQLGGIKALYTYVDKQVLIGITAYSDGKGINFLPCRLEETSKSNEDAEPKPFSFDFLEGYGENAYAWGQEKPGVALSTAQVVGYHSNLYYTVSIIGMTEGSAKTNLTEAKKVAKTIIENMQEVCPNCKSAPITCEK